MLRKIKSLNRKDYLLLFGIFLYLLTRCVFLFLYNFKYTDQDQLVMWLGTVQMKNGHLREPMWMGQNYGTMLESFLALPLYLIGVPLKIALPSASFFLGILPFLLLEFFCLRDKKYVQGFGILGVMALTSIDWDVMTSIPRTFIPGYVITTIGLLICIRGSKRWLQVLGGFFTALGVVYSADVICMLLPTLVCILWQHKKLRKQAWALLGIVPTAAVDFFSQRFYTKNPAYLMWEKPDMSYNLSYFWEKLPKVGSKYLDNLSVFGNGWIFMVVILLLFLVLWMRGNQGPALAVLLTLGGLFLIPGFEKFAVHSSTVLWSVLRYFLFVPYNIAMALFLTDVNQPVAMKKGTAVVLATVILFTFYAKYSSLMLRWEDFVTDDFYHTVESTDTVEYRAQAQYELFKNSGCDFVVVPNESDSAALAALYNEEVACWGPIHDRNNYVFMKERYKERDSFLFIVSEGPSFKGEIVETGGRSVMEFLAEEPEYYGGFRSEFYSNWDGE